ncbi:MAG TPA: DNA primase [Leucothrix mucor]|nr:DNA primase [Leucothrix mucor]
MASGRIPREFIDDLLLRVDIVEVINARVPLKKKGREYSACCPFHNEKTPSFTVSPTKQFYHCFGCGAHGTAITFLMDYDHQEFVESIESLAESLGVAVPREGGGKAPSPEQHQRAKDLFTLMEEASDFYQIQLKGSEQAIAYLKGRELSGEISKQYNIGYAPEGWNNLQNHFSRNYSEQKLVDSGLLIKKDDGKTYDRYRERIMFPIRNRKGQVIGFGGRVLGDDLPKYINSPETSLFHKGRELYGFYEARKYTKKLDRIIVVEGYMDVIALAQFGISYAVATLGTATTQDHIKILFRTVPEIIFCFDGDRAGREAAWRAVENTLPVMQDGKEIRFLFLPDGEDPDTQVRKSGKEGFEASYNDAISFSAYFIDALHERYNISTNEGKARYLNEAAKLLKVMPESLVKDQLLESLSKLTNVSVATIQHRKDVSQHSSQQNEQGDEPQTTFSRLSNREVKKTPIRYAITLLLSAPNLVQFVDNIEQIALSNLPGSDLLTTLIETLQENPNTNAAVLMERWRNTELESAFSQLIKWQPESDDEAILSSEFKDCLLQIAKKATAIKIETLLHKDRTTGLSDAEKQDLRELFKNK